MGFNHFQAVLKVIQSSFAVSLTLSERLTMKFLPVICTSLFLSASAMSVMADTATLTPDADTYTRSGYSAGTRTFIDVRGFGTNDFIGYLRFDLSGLNIDTVSDATLSLPVIGGSRSDGFTADRFANFGLLNVAGNTPQNWDELTLADGGLGAEYGGGTPATLTNVFNLDAERGATVTETWGTVGSTNTLTGADLVTFLNGQVDDGGLTTFILCFDANGRGNGYGSKDNADSAVWPTLELTYTVVPEPSTLALVGMGITGLLVRRRIGGR